MQDIDFDEIDRAVSSVTTGDAPVVPPVPTETPSVETPQQDASPAVKRSSGRFMDVVHPSSDMRPETTVPSRTPAPAAPSFHREEQPAASSESDTSRPAPAAVASGAFHWPEATVDAQPAAATAAAAASPVAAVPIADAVAQALAGEDLTPLESPFLTDTKVEKRPLGAFSTEPPVIEQTPVEEPSPEPAATPEVQAPAEAPVEAPKEELLLEATSETEALPSEQTSDPQAVVEQPSGPTSITQQYTEQPSGDTQQTGAIYDTEAYHQPLTHTPKKAGGAMVALWITALVIVGAGIGAGIYFIVLPMLG